MASNNELIKALQSTQGQIILDWMTEEYLLADQNTAGQDPAQHTFQAGQRDVVFSLRYKDKPRSE